MNAERLLQLIDDTDARTFALLDDFTDEQLHVPYEAGINPPVWEIGHCAFFYEYFLLRPLLGIEPIMPGSDTIWDSFDIPHRERWTEGVVAEKSDTLAYYRKVLDQTRELISPDRDPADETRYLAQYCIAHQCMHLESLVWCRQTLGHRAPSFAQRDNPPLSENPLDPSDAEVPEGDYSIGVPVPEEGKKADSFSFDNERPGFVKTIPGFQISRTLVTQGQFRDFADDGGYHEQNHWSFGGRYWLRNSGRDSPAYWENGDGEWRVRRFDKIEIISPDAPMLHISFWEAEAYCNWAGRRLPNEYEWEAAARGPESRRFPWGDTDPTPGLADLDCRHLATAPATAFPESASPVGCLQMIGTAWEWTTSQYLPFDGFCVDMYPYMSTLQFGDHKTARGGSFATSQSLIRNTYRQAFHPDRHDVFTGFRTCALDE